MRTYIQFKMKWITILSHDVDCACTSDQINIEIKRRFGTNDHVQNYNHVRRLPVLMSKGKNYRTLN